MQSLGTLIIALVAILVAMLLTGFLILIGRKYNLGKKLGEMIKNKMFFNAVGRYLLQSYLKFSLLMATSYVTFDCTTKQGIINAAIGIAVTLVVAGFPVITIWFLKKNR